MFVGAQSLAVLRFFLYVVMVGDVVFGEVDVGVGFEVLFGVEEVAADKGWVVVAGVGPSVFVGTVEGGANFAFAGLLVEVDGAARGAFGEVGNRVGQLSLAYAFIHAVYDYNYLTLVFCEILFIYSTALEFCCVSC